MTDELRAAKVAGINAAWEKERELIMQGQGTRDWTPEEQLVLRDLGRIPSYAGHHMKSANTYPEYAADSNNIQFLSYLPDENGQSEHLDGAHQGNTHQPTNGYYDYQTGEMIDFGDNPPTPPPVIQLSNPYVMEVQQRREAELAAEQAMQAQPEIQPEMEPDLQQEAVQEEEIQHVLEDAIQEIQNESLDLDDGLSMDD